MGLSYVFLLLAGFASAQESPDWSRPRDLPSLSVSWRLAVDACDVRATENVVLILSEKGLTAHRAETGEILWEQVEVGSDCLYSVDQLQLAGGAVFVGTSRGVYRLDEASGDVTEFLALGRVHDFIRSPLLVGVEEDDNGHFLVRLDPLSGREEARANLPGYVWSLAATNDMVLVIPSESDNPAVRALRRTDLSEVWRRSGYSRVQLLEGDIYLQSLDADGYAADLHRVNPATGKLTGRLPPREDA